MTDLSALRHDIDAIDQQIIQLLKDRMAIVDQVGSVKTQQGEQCFIKPAREATMLRDIINQLQDTYPIHAIHNIWRMIISSSIYHEQKLTIGLVQSSHEAITHAACAAEQYFGQFIPRQLCSSSEELISFVAGNPVHIGLIDPNDTINEPWWTLLTKHSLFVYTHIPLITRTPNTPIFSIGHVEPAETGNDRSLWVIESSADDQAVLQILRDHGIQSKPVARDKNTQCIDISGFFIDKNHRTIQKILDISGKTITDITPIGAYAAPMEVIGE